MSAVPRIEHARSILAETGRLPDNPLVGLAQRREQRQGLMQPGWKRNAWVFLLAPLLFLIALVISIGARSGAMLGQGGIDEEPVRILAIVILVPLALLWLLGGLFRLCRDSLGWYSEIKDSGGAQMLDGMICISPLDDLQVLLAGIRLNAVPIWPRILAAVAVFCGCHLLAIGGDDPLRLGQALIFLPLTFICMSLAGMLGSVLLSLYLMMVGLHLSFNLLVPIISFLIAMLQFFVVIFGSVFFAEISSGERIAGDLWPLAILGLLAGFAVVAGSAALAFRGNNRRTWLMVVVPLLVPVIAGFAGTLIQIVGGGGDDESFIAFFGNMMWVYNALMPFSPFAAPTTMFIGTPVLEAWNTLAFEFWRWPLLFMTQLAMLGLLGRYALQATAERRTPQQ